MENKNAPVWVPARILLALIVQSMDEIGPDDLVNFQIVQLSKDIPSMKAKGLDPATLKPSQIWIAGAQAVTQSELAEKALAETLNPFQGVEVPDSLPEEDAS